LKWPKWPRTWTWIAWLRTFAKIAYGLTIIYIFFRPTAEEYFRANGIHFAADMSFSWSFLGDVVKSVAIHWGSFSASTFFSFLLFSIGFAMIWWLLSEGNPEHPRPTLDTLAQYGPWGYTRAAVVTLLSTVIIVAAASPSASDKVGVATIITSLALATIIVLYGWTQWGKEIELKDEHNPSQQAAGTS